MGTACCDNQWKKCSSRSVKLWQGLWKLLRILVHRLCCCTSLDTLGITYQKRCCKSLSWQTLKLKRKVLIRIMGNLDSFLWEKKKSQNIKHVILKDMLSNGTSNHEQLRVYWKIMRNTVLSNPTEKTICVLSCILIVQTKLMVLGSMIKTHTLSCEKIFSKTDEETSEFILFNCDYLSM